MAVLMDCNDPNQKKGRFRNRDTNAWLRWPRWVELEGTPEIPSLFSAFRCEPNAYTVDVLGLSPYTVTVEQLAEIIYEDRARLTFFPYASPIPVKPTSIRDLVASLDEARRSMVTEKFVIIPGEECEYPGCHQPVKWHVSEEVEIEPQKDARGRKWERAVAVKFHKYCNNPRHFRLPVFKSLRGVESEVNIPEGDDGRPK